MSEPEPDFLPITRVFPADDPSTSAVDAILWLLFVVLLICTPAIVLAVYGALL